jgi:hypothetical protein
MLKRACIGIRKQAISDKNESADGFIPQTDVEIYARTFRHVTSCAAMA